MYIKFWINKNNINRKDKIWISYLKKFYLIKIKQNQMDTTIN